jgi:uncharacterized small protein (TIGR04563 family)
MEQTNTSTGETKSEKDNRKQSLYFPGDMLAEMKEEAARLDRSLSWVVQRAWKVAKGEIAGMPGINAPNPDDE